MLVALLDALRDDHDTDDTSSFAAALPLPLPLPPAVTAAAFVFDVADVEEPLTVCAGVDVGAVGASFDGIGGTTGLLLAVAVRRDVAEPGGRFAFDIADPFVPVLATELLSSLSASLFCCSSDRKHDDYSIITEKIERKMSVL